MAGRLLATVRWLLLLAQLCAAWSLDTRFVLQLQRCAVHAGAWTIQSLARAGGPNCTTGPSYDPNQTTALQAQLLAAWPGCGAVRPEQGWAQGWEQHGRCTGLGELDYLNAALAAWSRNAKFCSQTAASCYFCFNAAMKPIARSLCATPSPPSPPSPQPRTLHLQLEKCAGSSEWSIHGLWPEWASNCSGAGFDMQQLTDMLPQLHTAWRTCPEYNSSYPKFWGHEWVTHGVCTGWSQHTYFNTTLQLFNSHRGSCPPEPSAKSCWFCFNATDNSLNIVDDTLCHRPETRGLPDP